ncbi:unnamed protein product [Discosporangium mesarthrocarpum]
MFFNVTVARVVLSISAARLNVKPEYRVTDDGLALEGSGVSTRDQVSQELVGGGMSISVPGQQLWRLSIPVGIATTIDLLLTNASLCYVEVAFFTIVKSSGLIWLLMWAIVLGLEKPSVGLVSSVFVIFLGLTLACWGETEFSWIGMVMVLGSSCLSGLRWALTQRMKAFDKRFDGAVLTVYHVTLPAFFSMAPASLLEAYQFFRSEFAQNSVLFWEFLGISAFCGCIAFVLLTVEVKLIRLTSSLTMAVFGSIREVVQIVLAVVTLSDRLSALSVLGLAVVMTGSWAFKVAKYGRGTNPGDFDVEKEFEQEEEEEGAVVQLNDMGRRKLNRPLERWDAELSSCSVSELEDGLELLDHDRASHCP